MTAFFVGLGRFSVRFRWPIVLAWIVVTVVSVRVFPSLASVAKDTTSGFLPQSSPSIHASQLAAPFQNSNRATMTLVVSTSDGSALNAPTTATLASIESQVRTMAHVTNLKDYGPSPDHQAQQALVQTDLPPYSQSSDAKTLVSNVRALLPRPGTTRFHLTGSLPTIIDSQGQSTSTRSSIQTLSLLLIVVLLLVAFRALLAPLITLFPAALVLLLSSPVIAAATHVGVQASSITQFLLIVLVLGAGTDYGLFLVYRMREELQNGAEPHEAVRIAVRTVGESITFSALTVMVALVSLVVAQFGLYQSLGPALAIGIGLMLLAGLTLLPALLAIFGRAVFWPSRARPTLKAPRTQLYARIAGAVVQHPRAVAAVGLLLFVGLALGQLGAPSAGFADQSSSSSTDSGAGAAALTSHYGSGGTNTSVVLFTFTQPIFTHPADLAAIENGLRATGQFATLSGPVEVIQAAGGPAALQSAVSTASAGKPSPLLVALSRFISADGRTVQVPTLLKNSAASDPKAIAAIPTVRSAVSAVAISVRASDSGIIGILPLAYDVNSISATDLTHILPLVAFLIAVLLAIVLRSMVAPLYLVASVLLSYLAAIGITAIIFVHIGGDSGINFVLPFLMFVFLMALGSDYNILVMTRIREEAQRLPLPEAIRRAVSLTGTTVTTAGVILGGTFAVLAIAGGGSGGSQIKQIGWGIAGGVLMDTFLVRTILVPSFVAVLGRWNWWPSSLFRGRPLAPSEVVTEEAA